MSKVDSIKQHKSSHKINAEWHQKNKMPKNPTEQERIKWHKAHAKHCQCRKMAESIKRLINKGE